MGRRDAALALTLAGFAFLVAIMTAHIAQGKPEAYLLPTTWVALFSAAFSLDLALAGVAALRRRRVQSRAAPQDGSLPAWWISAWRWQWPWDC